MATATETIGLGRTSTPTPATAPLVVTEKAAEEVKRHVADVAAGGSVQPGEKLYLRVSDIRGGRTADDPLPDLRGEKGVRVTVRGLLKTVRGLSVEAEGPREK